MTFPTNLYLHFFKTKHLKVAHYQLMKYNAVRAFVQKREYLIWPEDPQDLEWFYERLVSQILSDTKVKKFAEDKAEPAQPDIQIANEDNVQLENIQAITAWTLTALLMKTYFNHDNQPRPTSTPLQYHP